MNTDDKPPTRHRIGCTIGAFLATTILLIIPSALRKRTQAYAIGEAELGYFFTLGTVCVISYLLGWALDKNGK